jgi:hyperosmotically inducible protein
MKRKTMYSLALAAAAVGLFATSKPLRAAEAEDKIPSSLKQPSLYSKIYVYMPDFKDDRVSLEVHEGVATLTGTVAEESHKALAQATVTNLPGVVRVENHLTIKTEVAAKSTDIRTKVEAREGGVAATGIAGNAADKSLATTRGADMQGATGVENEMMTDEAKTK